MERWFVDIYDYGHPYYDSYHGHNSWLFTINKWEIESNYDGDVWTLAVF